MKDFVNISEAVKKLKREFPDLTASNLRYWEEQKLVSPRRTKGGHRLYCEEDLDRIRLVKRLQTKRYYPLAIIRGLLEKKSRKGAALLENEAVGEGLLRPLRYDPAFVPVGRKELARKSGFPVSTIREMEKAGLLHPSRESGEVRFDEDDVRLAMLAKEITEIGVPLRAMGFYYPRLKALILDEFAVMVKIVLPHFPENEVIPVFNRLVEAAAEIRAHLYHKIMLEVVAEHEGSPGLLDKLPRRSPGRS